MSFQSEPGAIRWSMHFRSSPERVFEALATDAGRCRFWAESSTEMHGAIRLTFSGHPPVTARVLEQRPFDRLVVEYFGSRVEFTVRADGQGGADLSLRVTDVPEGERAEVIAGWVSVLMAMKAAVDHGIDLRNHDPMRCWATGYADN